MIKKSKEFASNSLQKLSNAASHGLSPHEKKKHSEQGKNLPYPPAILKFNKIF